MRSAVCAVIITGVAISEWSSSIHSTEIASTDSLSVEFYGKVFPYLVSQSGSGATKAGTPVATLAAKPTGKDAIPSKSGWASGNSRFGIHVTKTLPYGLKAIFQAEGSIHINQNKTNTLTDRNTYAELAGGFGDVRVGTMNSVFKKYGNTVGFFGVGSGTFMSDSSVLRKVGFGTNSASSFHLRRDHSIIYDTPDIHGFSASAQWESNETTTGKQNPSMWDIGMAYGIGPVRFLLAREVHRNFFGGSYNVSASQSNLDNPRATSLDTATELTVEWHFGKDERHKIEFGTIWKDYNENNITALGHFKNYRNFAYKIGVQDHWGERWRTVVHLVHADPGSCTIVGEVCNTVGLEATKISAGASYDLNRSAWVFASYSLLLNGKSARFSNAEFGFNPSPGEDLTQVAVGFAYRF